MGRLKERTMALRNIPPKLQELSGSARARVVSSHQLNYDLDHLAGTWSTEEATAFEATLAEQRRVDPELWG